MMTKEKIDALEQEPVQEHGEHKASEEAIKQFTDALQQVMSGNHGDKLTTKVDHAALARSATIDQVKDATKQAKRGKKIVMTTMGPDGKEHKTIVGRKFLQSFFHGALCEMVEQAFNAYDVMGERMERGVPANQIVQSATFIISTVIDKAIYTLDGERDLSTQQKHTLIFLKLAKDKMAALNGLDSMDPEVQVSALKVMRDFMYALNHMMHPATKPDYRLKVIDDYRNGRDKRFCVPVKNAENPIVNLHNYLFAGKEKPTENADVVSEQEMN